jgi:Kef-type K+ transport system membrane component KefB
VGHACSLSARATPPLLLRAQVLLTVLGVAAFAITFAGLPGPSAIVLGGALAMSTTAVAIQVLEERGEMGSRHGRATFSVLLFQVGAWAGGRGGAGGGLGGRGGAE